MRLMLGDCKEKLKELPEDSVDAIVTDPPYELGFMGKKWDASGIAYDVEVWSECLRVLKPGGHLLAFGGTRTYHRMAVAIEDAGFEVRDMIEWIYGSGFPKSRNIGLDIDKKNGITKNRGKAFVVAGQSGQKDKDTGGDLVPGSNTMGAYVAKNEWSGWGTALKPAHEPICMARKPLSEKTVAENCLKWGTGGINIDGSRVETTEDLSINGNRNNVKSHWGNSEGQSSVQSSPLGRFPANLIHDNSEEVRECFPDTKSGKAEIGMGNDIPQQIYGKYAHKRITSNFADSGNASRFFKSIIYTAKASKSERNKGCEDYEDSEPAYKSHRANYATTHGIETPYAGTGRSGKNFKNFHPTVKPVALMEYLITMVSKEGQTILDPFMGSGSTGVACMNTSRDFIGIEIEKDYLDIAEKRIGKASETPRQGVML